MAHDSESSSMKKKTVKAKAKKKPAKKKVSKPKQSEKISFQAGSTGEPTMLTREQIIKRAKGQPFK